MLSFINIINFLFIDNVANNKVDYKTAVHRTRDTNKLKHNFASFCSCKSVTNVIEIYAIYSFPFNAQR